MNVKMEISKIQPLGVGREKAVAFPHRSSGAMACLFRVA